MLFFSIICHTVPIKLNNLASYFHSSTLLILTKDNVGSLVIDSMLDSNHQSVYDLLFKLLLNEEKVIELACHPVANFVVQRLIAASTSADQVARFCSQKRGCCFLIVLISFSLRIYSICC